MAASTAFIHLSDVDGKQICIRVDAIAFWVDKEEGSIEGIKSEVVPIGAPGFYVRESWSEIADEVKQTEIEFRDPVERAIESFSYDLAGCLGRMG